MAAVRRDHSPANPATADEVPAPKPAVARPLPRPAAESRRHAAEALLAEAIACGRPLEEATREAVEALSAVNEWNAAWALAEGVGRLPGGLLASRVGHAVMLHRRRQLDRLWTRVQEMADDELRTHLPIETVDAALSTGTPESRARGFAMAAEPAVLPAEVLVALAGRFLALGEKDRAAALAEEVRRRGPLAGDERTLSSWALVDEWLSRVPTEVPEGSLPVAVIDYQSPDQVLASGNLGDYVQTLAMLGNLARLEAVRFTGEGGLGELVTELQGRVRPALRLPEPDGSVHLVGVSRDASSIEHVPPGTWMVAFGWHMHPLYDLRYDFPYHENIRPIFVSFHVNRLDMLSGEALEYLRRHGPVGCRDWTTVFLLLSAGVDAFFTGCLTTTVDAVFPAREATYTGDGPVGLIDITDVAAAQTGRTESYSHQDDRFRQMPLVEGVHEALGRLEEHQRHLASAVTRRLHAYLPLTALGVRTDFRPWSSGDVRFRGLGGLTPGSPRLTTMQQRIRHLISTALETALSGAAEEDVYATWRSVTADLVTEARERWATPAREMKVRFDVAAAVAACAVGSVRFGPHDAVDPANVTDVALCFDDRLAGPAAVTIESMLAHASGPVRLTVMGRGLDSGYQRWLASAFPSLPLTFVPCDHVDYAAVTRNPSRITVSTMDRLLLPHLLEVDRVVYLDVDTVVLGDVVELASTDLEGHAVAARDSNVSEASEWRAAARRLPGNHAAELQRITGYRHGYGGRALNAGVLVLDLARMRADDFTRTYLGWVQRYRLHDQDVLLAYTGGDRVSLEPRWNHLPVLEDLDDPALIHWASLDKPWDSRLTYRREVWQEFADALVARVGKAPRPGPAPLDIGPAEGPLGDPLDEVVAAVQRERLSYLGQSALRTLASAVRDLEADRVPGALVEAGAALGGSAIVMARAKAIDRPLKVYDVFGMIPPPGARDGTDVHERYEVIASGQSQGLGGDTYYGYRDDLLAAVTSSFARHGAPVEETSVELIPGLFEDTLHPDGPIALAHLDGDWYESTMTCLRRIVPNLSRGGRLVIDDYDLWSGCRTAVDEYFAGRGEEFRFERRGKLHVVRR